MGESSCFDCVQDFKAKFSVLIKVVISQNSNVISCNQRHSQEIVEMADRITVKAQCDAVIRRFSIPGTFPWRDLERKVKDLFELRDCVIKYEDDEKEWITLGSQAELEEALLICQRSHSPILRLMITKENMVRIPVTDTKADAKCKEGMMVQGSGQQLQAAKISQTAVDQPVKPSSSPSMGASDDLSYTPTDCTGTSAEKIE